MESFITNYLGGKFFDFLFNKEDIIEQELKMLVFDSYIGLVYLSKKLENLTKINGIKEELLNSEDKDEIIKEIDKFISMTKEYEATPTTKSIYENWKDIKINLQNNI